jgi:hypothetical protein
MATIGKLVAEIVADDSGLKQGLSSAVSATDKAAGDITKAVKDIASAFGAYLTADMFIGFVKGSMDAAAQLGKLSQQTGIAVESLSALQYAASLNGASIEDLDGALKGLANKMLEAKAGGNEAAEVFKALGIAVADSSGNLRNSEDVLMDMADAFAGMEDGAGKAALSQKLMEDAGVALIPVLNQGRAGMAAMTEEARQLGVIIDKETAAAASALNDNLKRLDATSQGLGRVIGNAVVPVLTQLGTEALTAMRGADSFKESSEGLRTVMVGLAKAGIGVVAAYQGIGTAIGGVAAAAAAAASGEFKQAGTIIDMLGDDLDAIALKAAGAMERVANATSTPVAAPPAPGTRTAAPSITAPEAPKAPKAAAAAQAAKDELGDFAQARIEEQEKRFQREEEMRTAFLARNAEAFKFSTLSEMEQEQLKYEEKLRLLDEYLVAEPERMAEFYGVKEAAAEEHEARMLAIRQRGLSQLEKFNDMSWQDQAKTVAGAMAQQLTSVNTNSKAMFNIQKAASMAQAIMDTYAGANRALKDYPAPYSYAVAGATMAAGLARVSAIRSQSFGGAMAAGATAGGGGASVTSGMNTTGATAPAQNQTITISGVSGDSLFGGDSVRALIDKLIDAQRNGAKIVLA